MIDVHKSRHNHIKRQCRLEHANRLFLIAISKIDKLIKLILIMENRMVLLTKPATTKPPTVPCDPIEATANRDITDNCSCEIPV